MIECNSTPWASGTGLVRENSLGRVFFRSKFDLFCLYLCIKMIC
jgi:hypothetical protein